MTQLSNISISQNLPSTRTTVIFTCFLLFFSILFLQNYPSTSNTFLSTASALTSQLISYSNSVINPSSPNNTKTCDIFDGRWVYDDSYPIYAPGSCSYVENEFNCFRNSRPDFGYLKYRWQPYGCDLPRSTISSVLCNLFSDFFKLLATISILKVTWDGNFVADYFAIG